MLNGLPTTIRVDQESQFTSKELVHGSRRSTYANDGAYPAPGVHDRENPQTASIEQLIMHPVHRPYLIGSRRITAIIPQFGHDASAWRFEPRQRHCNRRMTDCR